MWSFLFISNHLQASGWELAKLRSYGRERRRLWDLGDRTTMMVFDEAHQAVATTYQDIVEAVVTRNQRTPLLGLSATPGRTWGLSSNGTEMYAKGVDRYLPERRLRRIQE